jgi:hypothetical protein
MLPSRQVNAQPTNAAVADERMIAPTTNQSHNRHSYRSSCQPRTGETRINERIEDEKGGYIPEYQKPAPAASEISQIQEISMQSLHKSCAIPRYRTEWPL